MQLFPVGVHKAARTVRQGQTRNKKDKKDPQTRRCLGTVSKEIKLEDLKVLRRSPDLLNNFKTGLGQLKLIMKPILFYHIWRLQSFWSSSLNNLTAQWF